MIPFIVHDSAGRILRTGFCAPHMVAAQARPGETAIEGRACDATQHVEGGKVCEGLLPLQEGAPCPPCEAEIKARRYLQATDWYAARLAETGKPIPPEVAAKRAAARETVNAMRGE